MKKRLAILALSLLTALAAGGAALAAASPEELPPEPEPEAPSPAARESRGYILMERDGTLGVYMDGELLRSVEADLSPLGEADRQLLRQGIERDSIEEILALMEDFES